MLDTNSRAGSRTGRRCAAPAPEGPAGIRLAAGPRRPRRGPRGARPRTPRRPRRCRRRLPPGCFVRSSPTAGCLGQSPSRWGRPRRERPCSQPPTPCVTWQICSRAMKGSGYRRSRGRRPLGAVLRGRLCRCVKRNVCGWRTILPLPRPSAGVFSPGVAGRLPVLDPIPPRPHQHATPRHPSLTAGVAGSVAGMPCRAARGSGGGGWPKPGRARARGGGLRRHRIYSHPSW